MPTKGIYGGDGVIGSKGGAGGAKPPSKSRRSRRVFRRRGNRRPRQSGPAALFAKKASSPAAQGIWPCAPASHAALSGRAKGTVPGQCGRGSGFLGAPVARKGKHARGLGDWPQRSILQSDEPQLKMENCQLSV